MTSARARVVVGHRRHRTLIHALKQQHVVSSLDFPQKRTKNTVTLDDLFKEVAVNLKPGLGQRRAALENAATLRWCEAAVADKRLALMGRPPGMSAQGRIVARRRWRRLGSSVRPCATSVVPRRRAPAMVFSWRWTRAGPTVEMRTWSAIPRVSEHGLRHRRRSAIADALVRAMPRTHRRSAAVAAWLLQGSATRFGHARPAHVLRGRHAVLAQSLCQPGLQLQRVGTVRQAARGGPRSAAETIPAIPQTSSTQRCRLVWSPPWH
mmetsp:Transcript_58811/g.164215  ORF Transcript_58811/g.164215 Transcript_58811/m.164215 type:complete len:265 (+) Transcript_58811:1436-2230(+)